MNPQLTPKKPYTNTFETENWSEHKVSLTTNESRVDTHNAWEAYLSAPEQSSSKIEKPQAVEASLVEIEKIEVNEAPNDIRESVSLESLEQSFYSSTYQNRLETISSGVFVREEKSEKSSIDIYTPLETIGKGTFTAVAMINKVYKIATAKDVKAAAKDGFKGFWDYFVTGEAFKKKDPKKDQPKEAPIAPRPFVGMSTEQNNRIKMSTVQINQQLGNNHAYRGAVNQATGEVYAYYQAEAERAQTFAQKQAEKRQSALQEPEGKKTAGIPGMGKNAKKGQGPRLEMSLERQHSSKGATLTSALG